MKNEIRIRILKTRHTGNTYTDKKLKKLAFIKSNKTTKFISDNMKYKG